MMSRTWSRGDARGFLAFVTMGLYLGGVVVAELLTELMSYLTGARVSMYVKDALCLSVAVIVGLFVARRYFQPMLEERYVCPSAFWGLTERLIMWGTLLIGAGAVSVVVLMGAL
jgi:hypothetical protein